MAVIVKITEKALWITIILALSGCSSTSWEKRVLAVGWAKDSTPIVLQWVPTGATIFVGRSFPVIIYASGGHYKIVHGSKSKDIDIPETGMSKTPGQPSYKWFYIVDEERLLAAGHKYTGTPHNFAIEFDIINNRILNEVRLKYVRGAPDSIIAEDLSYQASPTANGLVITNLSTGEVKTVFSGCRVRYARFSSDSQRLAALLMVPDDMIESFPFKDRFKRIPVYVHSDKAIYGRREAEAWIGVAVLESRSANIIDVRSLCTTDIVEFTNRAYNAFPPFGNFTYQQQMLFSFSPMDESIICMGTEPDVAIDQSDKLFLHSVRSMGPYVSPDGNMAGFYVWRHIVYWWDVHTGKNYQFDVP